MHLLIFLPVILAESCYLNKKQVVYLCDWECDIFYYQHTAYLPSDYECTIDSNSYGKFEVWNMCDDVTATYSSYTYTEGTKDCELSQ